MRVDLRAEWLIGTALAVLLLPLRWVAALILAMAFHEACHLLVLRLLGVKLGILEAGSFGAKLSTASMTRRQELIGAAAGPVGSLCLLAFFDTYPELAVCGLAQGFYNLLPVYPLDGGRILRCAVDRLFPNRAEGIEKAVRNLTFVILCVFAAVCVSLFPRWCGAVLLFLFCIQKNFLQRKGNRGTINSTMCMRGKENDTVTAADPAGGAEACPIYRR